MGTQKKERAPPEIMIRRPTVDLDKEESKANDFAEK